MVQVAAPTDSHAIVATKYFAKISNLFLAGVARIPKQSWLLGKQVLNILFLQKNLRVD